MIPHDDQPPVPFAVTLASGLIAACLAGDDDLLARLSTALRNASPDGFYPALNSLIYWAADGVTALVDGDRDRALTATVATIFQDAARQIEVEHLRDLLNEEDG